MIERERPDFLINSIMYDICHLLNENNAESCIPIVSPPIIFNVLYLT